VSKTRGRRHAYSRTIEHPRTKLEKTRETIDKATHSGKSYCSASIFLSVIHLARHQTSLFSRSISFYFSFFLNILVSRLYCRVWQSTEMNSESTYAHCKSGAVVTEVLCFSGSNQWTAHPKQQHALTYTSTFWYVLKIFLLLGCTFSTRLVALRSIHPEMQTISAMTAFSLTGHARSRVIKIVRYSFGISICLNEILRWNVESSITFELASAISF